MLPQFSTVLRGLLLGCRTPPEEKTVASGARSGASLARGYKGDIVSRGSRANQALQHTVADGLRALSRNGRSQFCQSLVDRASSPLDEAVGIKDHDRAQGER